jgi:hypothetical protein
MLVFGSRRNRSFPVFGSTLNGALLVSLILGHGCGPARFRPPAAEAPHADLLLEVAYRSDLGEELTEQVLLDGRRILVPQRDAKHKLSWARSIRVAPGAHEVVFHAAFEHANLVQGFERPLIPGCTPMRSTSVVANDCINSSQAQPVSTWEWDTDAECEKTVLVASKPGEEIRLTFSFVGHAQCGVKCMRREKGAQGLVPCDPS